MICPFCRTVDESDKQWELEQEIKRANAGQPGAMRRIAGFHYFGHGKYYPQKDKAEGWKWYMRAVEAGSGEAAMDVGKLYWEGDFVEKDDAKALEYSQKAASLGEIHAYKFIGDILMKRGDLEEAMLNYRKALICGLSDASLFKRIRNGFKDGYITRDEYAYTLKEYQATSEEAKSEGREEVKRLIKDEGSYFI